MSDIYKFCAQQSAESGRWRADLTQVLDGALGNSKKLEGKDEQEVSQAMVDWLSERGLAVYKAQQLQSWNPYPLSRPQTKPGKKEKDTDASCLEVVVTLFKKPNREVRLHFPTLETNALLSYNKAIWDPQRLHAKLPPQAG